jgi:hypothetical protein
LTDLYRAFTGAYDRGRVLTRLDSEAATALAPAVSGGFDWSSAGIAVAAVAGLAIVSVAVVTGLRHGKGRRG